MRYNRTELVTLAAIMCVLVLGLVLVAPRFVQRLEARGGSQQTAIALELDPEPQVNTDDPAGGVTIDTASAKPPGTTARSRGTETIPTKDGGSGIAVDPPTIYVYVTGAVTKPGVAQLPEGARVFEALDEVGGALETGALEYINLALELQDGQMIYVPTLSELTSGKTDDGLPLNQLGGCLLHGSMIDMSGAKKPAGATQLPTININTAGYQELQSVPGIGPALARRIMSYRQESGGFDSVDELTQVSGIGTATLEDIRPYISVR